MPGFVPSLINYFTSKSAKASFSLAFILAIIVVFYRISTKQPIDGLQIGGFAVLVAMIGLVIGSFVEKRESKSLFANENKVAFAVIAAIPVIVGYVMSDILLSKPIPGGVSDVSGEGYQLDIEYRGL